MADLDFPDGIPVGAFISAAAHIQNVKQLLRKKGWLKSGKNVTQYTALLPNQRSSDGGHGGPGGGAGKLFAIHVGPSCARRLPAEIGGAIPAGAGIPAGLATLLHDNSVRWCPGVRVYSPACKPPAKPTAPSGLAAGAAPVSVVPAGDMERRGTGAGDLDEDWAGPPRKHRKTCRTSGGAGGATFRFSELFCGIGGFRVGLDHLGGESVFSSELDNEAKATYAANFAGPAPHGDITEIEADDIADHDILTAGFPCQSFSRAGQMKGFDDDRGLLFLEIVRLLRRKQPRAFLLENVANLIYIDKGSSFATMLEAFAEIGYAVHWRIYNCRALLPQQRNRVYIVGFLKAPRGGGSGGGGGVPSVATPAVPPTVPPAGPPTGGAAFAWPELPVLGPTLRDALDDGVDDAVEFVLTGHQWEKVQQSEAYKRDPGHRLAKLDGGARTLISNYKSGYAIKSEFVLAESSMSSGAARTVPRFFTPRECARLQGFPEWFRVTATLKNPNRLYYQLGNAVCPVVVAAIAGAMLQHMGLAQTDPDPAKANRLAVAPALELLQSALKPGGEAVARVSAQCAAFLAQGGAVVGSPAACNGGGVAYGGVAAAGGGGGGGGGVAVAPPVACPVACNGHGAILTPADADLLRELLADPADEQPCLAALQAVGRLLHPIDPLDLECCDATGRQLVSSGLVDPLARPLLSPAAEVRRLAVVLMNNLLAVPSLAGTGRQAIAALGGPAALRPMLALTPTTDPPSRERQQLEQLIAALIA